MFSWRQSSASLTKRDTIRNCRSARDDAAAGASSLWFPKIFNASSFTVFLVLPFTVVYL